MRSPQKCPVAADIPQWYCPKTWGERDSNPLQLQKWRDEHHVHGGGAGEREIGVLRVVGFSCGNILGSFVIESALLGVAGGVALAFIAAWSTGLNNHLLSVGSTFFSYRPTPAAIIAGLAAAGANRRNASVGRVLMREQGWKLGQQIVLRDPFSDKLTLTLIPRIELPSLLTSRTLFFDRRLFDDGVKNAFGVDTTDRATFLSVRVDRPRTWIRSSPKSTRTFTTRRVRPRRRRSRTR